MAIIIEDWDELRKMNVDDVGLVFHDLQISIVEHFSLVSSMQGRIQDFS